MASIKEFELTLKQVVEAKRVSASKMANLKDLALRCMEKDTQLVSALYRTHKTLQPQGKIYSLYVFDSLSRAARHQVTKYGLVGDINTELGNCATFLIKVEGVLDGLFQDLIASNHIEAKEKCLKILDIWVKNNTFPSAVLARLSKLVKGAEQEPAKVAPTVTVDPRNQSTPPTAATPPQPPVAPQAPPAVPDANTIQLLALLQAAANNSASSGQIPPNNMVPPPAGSTPQLGVQQLTLLQQLTAGIGNIVPTQPVSLPVSLVPSSANAVPVVPPVGGPPQPLPYRDDRYGSGRRESNHNGYDDHERRRPRGEFHDDRRDFRGGFRGGPRGRGRGRWDDRDTSHRDRGRDRSPAFYRERRSRSRSPHSPHSSRYGGRREVKPHSPPRRPVGSPPPQRSPAPAAPGKDEFGRDLRTQSPSGTDPQPMLKHVSDEKSPAPSNSDVAMSVSNTLPASVDVPPLIMPISTRADSITSAASTSQNELQAFSLSAFDPTSPSAWEALGQAWEATNGYLPTQVELMQFVMGSMPVASQYGVHQGAQTADQEHGYRGAGGRSRSWRGGPGRGRGDHGYGNSRSSEWNHFGGAYDQQGTDAITLGGEGVPSYNSTSIPVQPTEPSGQHDPQIGISSEDDPDKSIGSGAAAGKMQRVDDKWVFVRSEAEDDIA